MDEADKLPVVVQSKLLRTLQERTVRRTGQMRSRDVDVRLVSTTTKEIRNNGFSQELYYRIAAARIYLPPVRERREDIEPLARFYLAQLCQEGTIAPVITLLRDYDFPGNVRELQNMLEVALAENEPLYDSIQKQLEKAGSASALNVSREPKKPWIGSDSASVKPIRKSSAKERTAYPSNITLAEAEKLHITAVYEACGRNAKKATKVLDICYQTVLTKLHKYGLM